MDTKETKMTDDVYDPIPETVADALRKWDAGESVFTVEMGGLGPGYEMAIQGLAFELMRVLTGFNFARADKVVIAKLEALFAPVVSACDEKPWGGFSGAQVGAAKSLAVCVSRRGYRVALNDEAVKDRHIQVSKKDLRSER
jgi:hypothetical protein